MAFSAIHGSNGSRGRRYSVGTLSEINMIPLVDVVLVLLIIFMVTAHVMQSGLDIQVPEVKEVKETAEDLPVVQVSKSGNLYLNDQAVNINELGQDITKRFPKQMTVYLQADKRVKWETPVQVMSALKEAHLGISVVVQEKEIQKP